MITECKAFEAVCHKPVRNVYVEALTLSSLCSLLIMVQDKKLVQCARLQHSSKRTRNSEHKALMEKSQSHFIYIPAQKGF